MDLVLVFVAALTFYGATLAPTVVWGDSASLTLSTFLGWTAFGTAGDHPLFPAVGHIFAAFPGDLGRNLNFESAVFGALAVTLVFRCARQLGTSRTAAAVGACALAVSHGFWLHAVIAEVYTANAFFLLATLTLLIDWKRHRKWPYLAAALAVFMIGLTNHLVLASLAPAIGVFVVATNPRAFLSRTSLLCLAVIVAVAIAVILARPAPLAEAAHRLWVGPPSIGEYFRPTIKPGPMLRESEYYLLFLGYQFPSLALPLGLAGLWVILRDNRGVAALLLLTIGVNAGIFIHQADWQSAATSKFVFYIADYAVFAILCALGANELLRRAAGSSTGTTNRRWGIATLAIVAFVPPIVYAVVPAAANFYGVDLVRSRPIRYRDSQTYFLNPNKHGYTGARRFGEEALSAVPPSAVIFADYTPYMVIRYLQLAEGLRRDVLVRAAPPGPEARVPVRWLSDGGQRRPTYIATLTLEYYDFTGLTADYDLVPVGPIFEVRPRDEQ